MTLGFLFEQVTMLKKPFIPTIPLFKRIMNKCIPAYSILVLKTEG